MKSILYGVGESIFQDLDDPKKILAMSKLQDLTISFGAESEEVHGGDDPYPIAEFPKTRSVTITAKDALFDIKYLEVSQGAKSTAPKEFEMTEVLNFVIPESLEVELAKTPTEGSVVIADYEKDEGTDATATGKFAVDGKKIKFHADDKGKTISGLYTHKLTKSVNMVEGFKSKFPKPFKFIHRMPVYNEDTQICKQLQLTVYKAKSDNTFEFNIQPQTAYAPQLTLKALDPKRPDKKLWDVVTVDVTPEEAEFGVVG